MKSKFIIISIILLIVANISIIYFKTYEGFVGPKKVETNDKPATYSEIVNAMKNLKGNILLSTTEANRANDSAVNTKQHNKANKAYIAAKDVQTSFDKLVTLTGIKLN